MNSSHTGLGFSAEQVAGHHFLRAHAQHDVLALAANVPAAHRCANATEAAAAAARTNTGYWMRARQPLG